MVPISCSKSAAAVYNGALRSGFGQRFMQVTSVTPNWQTQHNPPMSRHSLTWRPRPLKIQGLSVGERRPHCLSARILSLTFAYGARRLAGAYCSSCDVRSGGSA
jgi:hypothetical protein